MLSDSITDFQPAVNPDFNPLTSTSTFSKASYYTTLALYALSFPGLYSTVKRTTDAKPKSKTYVTPGAERGGRELGAVAGEIMAYMAANNYEVVERGETIKFKGVVKKSKGQAFFLAFCTAICLGSLALVLQIQFIDLKVPFTDISPNWFLLTLLSPYAAIYYWKDGDREENMSLKLTEADDGSEIEIGIIGDEEQLERMWKTLDFSEKGMVKIEPILGGGSK